MGSNFLLQGLAGIYWLNSLRNRS